MTAVKIILGDGTHEATLKNYKLWADKVLVDAPCSGLGTLRRHPEIRLKERNLTELNRIQLQLLEAGASAVKPGGALVYSVCTPVFSEGPGIIDAFLRMQPEFTRERASNVLQCLPENAVTAAGDVLLWPHRHECDAFFASRLIRK